MTSIHQRSPALFAALVIAVLACGASKGVAPVTESPATVRGALLALSVSNLEASTQWYVEKLELSVVMRIPKQGKTAVTVLAGGGLTVELIQNDDARPLRDAAPGVTTAEHIHGFFKAGFAVDDFDNTVATLRARGVSPAFGPFPARDGQPANVIIQDNAGNYIQILGQR